MLNFKLKMFLKYLRSNRIIEEYEMLFDKMFDYSKLLDLSDDSVERIYSNSDIASIILYEEINNIKISDDILCYIRNLNSKELQKYAVRMAISKYNSIDGLMYIRAVCEADNTISSRYAYAVAMSDKLDNIDDKYDYINFTARSEPDTSVQIRDLIFEGSILKQEDNLELLEYIANEKGYIAKYMIMLFNDTHSTNNLCILSHAIGETQARYTYEILSNSKLMGIKNSVFIALLVAQSEIDDGYKIISLIRTGNYDNLYEKVISILKKEEEDIDIEGLFRSRNLDKIIVGLELINSDKDIKRKVKK